MEKRHVLSYGEVFIEQGLAKSMKREDGESFYKKENADEHTKDDFV